MDDDGFDIERIEMTAGMRQNFPNPVVHSTVVPMQIPVMAQTAELVIVDVQGKMVKSFSIAERGANEFRMDASMGAGHYYYTLVVDGTAIDTKKMVVIGM